MPRLKKSSSTIVFKQKYSHRKWKPPSSHHKATKKGSHKQAEGKKISIFIWSDVALSTSVTKQDRIKKSIFKANEKQECQIIAYVFQDLLSFSPKKMWADAVKALKISLNLNKNQEAK
eukprot:8089606-Ditylum_brightwellii.AAC.1